MTRPAVAIPLLVDVMTRAGRRCEATRTTRAGVVRCDHEAPAHELVAAPRDPAIPDHAAWRVPAEDLAAWCIPCLVVARRKHEAAQRRHRKEYPIETALFAMDNLKPVTKGR